MRLICGLLLCVTAYGAPIYASGSIGGWTIDHVPGELLEYRDNRTSFTWLNAASPLYVSDSEGVLITGIWGVSDPRFAPYGNAEGTFQEQLYLETFTADATTGVFSGLISPRVSVMLGLNEAQHHLAGLLTIGRSYDLATGEAADGWGLIFFEDSVTQTPEPETGWFTAAVLLVAGFLRTRARPL